jgi:hypothetical protein
MLGSMGLVGRQGGPLPFTPPPDQSFNQGRFNQGLRNSSLAGRVKPGVGPPLLQRFQQQRPVNMRQLLQQARAGFVPRRTQQGIRPRGL